VYSLQFDDRKVVSGSADHSIKVWDVKTGRCELTLNGHANSVMCVGFDDDFKICSGSYDKTVRVWDMRMGSVLSVLEGHSSAVFCLQHDTERIVSGSADKNLIIWNYAK
jgi:F-box/WD-40 domain protein 7